MRRSNVIVLDRDFEERERYGLPPLEHEDLTVRIIPAVKKEKPKNAIKEETKKYRKESGRNDQIFVCLTRNLPSLLEFHNQHSATLHD